MINNLGAIKGRVDLVEIVGRDVELKRRGADEHWGRCPFHREKTPSFKVDAKRQRFICFGCGARGDTLDYLLRRDGLSTGEAIRRLGELAGATSPATAPSRQPGRRPLAEALSDLAPDPEVERRRELAQEVWRQTENIPVGLPRDYLTGRRGITVWDDDRVRWHPACPSKLAEDDTVVRRSGCVVCPVTDHATGYVGAIWCIRPVMAGRVPRWGLGPVKGSAARLFPAEGPALILAEGIEDTLAAYELYERRFPAWAALSAGNMAAVVVPPRIRSVLILADRDEPKEDGRQVGPEAAYKLARRLRAEGRSAEVRWSTIGKDANDVLRGTKA